MKAERRIWRGSGLGGALLKEAGDRQMREFSAALATLQIVRAGCSETRPLLDGAIGRLEDQVRLQQFLAEVTAGEVGEAVIRLAQMVSATRAEKTKLDIILGSSTLVLAGDDLRLVLLVCYQLLTSALGHPSPKTIVVGGGFGRASRRVDDHLMAACVGAGELGHLHSP